VPAVELKAGQVVYVSFYARWFTLASDPRPHRLSRNIVALDFEGLSQPEYRMTGATMHVRPDAGQAL
jgi:hypothetical protein